MRLHQISKYLRRVLPASGLLAALWCVSSPVWSQTPDAPPAEPAAPAPAAAERPDEIMVVGDKINLVAPKVGDRLGKITQTVISRDGIVDVKPIDPNVATAVQVTALKPGSVKITIIAEIADPKADKKTEATAVYRIQVNPRDLPRVEDTIRAGLKKHFPRANVTVERGDNAIILMGFVDSTEDIDPVLRYVSAHVGQANIINNIRVAGVMQVQLEVCVAQVNRNKLRQLGFNFFKTGDRNLGASTIGGLVSNPITGPTVTSTTVPPGFLMRSGQLASGSDRFTGNLLFGIFDEQTSFFGFIRALKQEEVAKVIANPTLVTINGRSASFLVGGEVPVPQATSTGTPSVAYKQFGTQLDFVPVILGDGKIRLDIRSEVSNARETVVGGFATFRFDTDRVQSMVELENGQTLAIGGLLQNRITGTISKYPVLGELPFAGTLFRSTSYQEEEIELLIMVTPRLVDPLDASQRPQKLPGQETRTPTDFELFLEGILEAPRGPRDLRPDGCYRPVHWNGHGKGQPAGHNGGAANGQPAAPAPVPAADGKVYYYAPRPVTPVQYELPPSMPPAPAPMPAPPADAPKPFLPPVEVEPPSIEGEVPMPPASPAAELPVAPPIEAPKPE